MGNQARINDRLQRGRVCSCMPRGSPNARRCILSGCKESTDNTGAPRWKHVGGTGLRKRAEVVLTCRNFLVRGEYSFIMRSVRNSRKSGRARGGTDRKRSGLPESTGRPCISFQDDGVGFRTPGEGSEKDEVKVACHSLYVECDRCL